MHDFGMTLSLLGLKDVPDAAVDDNVGAHINSFGHSSGSEISLRSK